MSQICAPHSGEELMDARTFSELHARVATRAERSRAEAQAPARPAAPPRQRVYELAELGGRVLAPVRAAEEPARATLRPPASAAAAAALEAEIDRCTSRDAVGRLAVYLSRSYATAAALLLVHRGMIEGLCSEGLAGQPDAILFPADAASIFGEVAASGRAFRGAPRAALDLRILRALGREHVQEIAVLPVSLGGRVVNLLYADNGPEAFGDASAAALTAVCTRVAAAYARLIHERKRGQA